jgi:NAD(P)H-hydrate epimerase
LNPILEEKLTEAMTYPLPETRSGTLALDSEKSIRELMEGKTALAIGPGLSTQVETVALVRRIVADCPLPLVIDADGLNAISGEKGVVVPCGEKTVLTPHPGEMGRLAGVNTAAVQSDRLGTVARFVQERRCWLVLKGARTLIAGPDNPTYVNPSGNKALASGGSGDILTGFISGLLARGWPIAKAACGGVFMHGLAADLLQENMGKSGILAHELAATFPILAHSLSLGNWPLNAAPPHADFYQPL